MFRPRFVYWLSIENKCRKTRFLATCQCLWTTSSLISCKDHCQDQMLWFKQVIICFTPVFAASSISTSQVAVCFATQSDSMFGQKHHWKPSIWLNQGIIELINKSLCFTLESLFKQKETKWQPDARHWLCLCEHILIYVSWPGWLCLLY